jgi:hypothetical protein
VAWMGTWINGREDIVSKTVSLGTAGMVEISGG